MPRRAAEQPARARAPAGPRALLLVLTRVTAATLLAAVVVAAVGGRDAYWLCLPGVVLAAGPAADRAGAAGAGAPVVVAALLAAGVTHGAGPVLWEALLVPVLCVLVARALLRRLAGQRDRLRHAALSDPLTGLANRRMLRARGEYEITRHRRGRATLVVVMLDLDGFKAVNDRYGHGAGDTLLCAVADALRAALRDQDTVARVGGDEFCVIAPDTSNPLALAAKVGQAVGQVTAGYQALSTSTGLAVFPGDGEDLERLLQIADGRLIAAKRRAHAMRRARVA